MDHWPVSTPNTTFGTARIIATGAFAAGLLLLGLAFYEWQQARRMKTELLLAEHSYISNLRRLHGLEASTRILDQQALKLKQDSDQLALGFGGTGGGGPSGAAGAGDAAAAGRQFLAAYPKARELLSTLARGSFATKFGPFFKAAGVNAAQIEQLENATVDTWTQSLAVYPGGGIRPTVIQPPDDQLRAILGDQVFQEYEAYGHIFPEQSVAFQIATAAGLAGAPMSSDLAMQLAQTIAATSDQNPSEQTVSIGSVNWDAASKQAQSLLSPEQYQAAQAAFAQMQYQQALDRARYSRNPVTADQPPR
jgi:hypothetical protein